MEKICLTGLLPAEIATLIPQVKERYRSQQIFRWIHEKCVVTFEEMSNLPKTFREEIADRFSIGALKLLSIHTSDDGSTEKFLFSCVDGEKIESVIIRDENRTTVCISSQVGCRMGCAFCRTGGMGFIRNLTTGEIVDQLLNMRRFLRSKGEDITNIVFMGMGEPLDNFDALVKAIGIINMEIGLSIGQRKITVSTCGVVSEIARLAHLYKKIGLAISLNASDDVLRSRLMPITRKYGIHSLLDAAREYAHITKRRVTFEYILIEGVNDSREDALKLRKIAARIPSKVNLIAFNECEELPYRRPSEKSIETFRDIMFEGNVTAMIRKSKGTDILAACGQLAAKKH